MQQNFRTIPLIQPCIREIHGSFYREAHPFGLRRWKDVSNRGHYFSKRHLAHIPLFYLQVKRKEVAGKNLYFTIYKFWQKVDA